MNDEPDRDELEDLSPKDEESAGLRGGSVSRASSDPSPPPPPDPKRRTGGPGGQIPPGHRPGVRRRYRPVN